MTQRNYWVVGASWPKDPQDEKFVEQGIWLLGKERSDPQTKNAEQMKPDDRIAIKSNLGTDGDESNGIEILHVGIIRGIPEGLDYLICTVDWLAPNVNRVVDFNGCMKTVNGPYTPDDEKDGEWVKKIFFL